MNGGTTTGTMAEAVAAPQQQQHEEHRHRCELVRLEDVSPVHDVVLWRSLTDTGTLFADASAKSVGAYEDAPIHKKGEVMRSLIDSYVASGGRFLVPYGADDDSGGNDDDDNADNPGGTATTNNKKNGSLEFLVPINGDDKRVLKRVSNFLRRLSTAPSNRSSKKSKVSKAATAAHAAKPSSKTVDLGCSNSSFDIDAAMDAPDLECSPSMVFALTKGGDSNDKFTIAKAGDGDDGKEGDGHPVAVAVVPHRKSFGTGHHMSDSKQPGLHPNKPGRLASYGKASRAACDPDNVSEMTECSIGGGQVPANHFGSLANRSSADMTKLENGISSGSFGMPIDVAAADIGYDFHLSPFFLGESPCAATPRHTGRPATGGANKTIVSDENSSCDTCTRLQRELEQLHQHQHAKLEAMEKKLQRLSAENTELRSQLGSHNRDSQHLRERVAILEFIAKKNVPIAAEPSPYPSLRPPHERPY